MSPGRVAGVGDPGKPGADLLLSARLADRDFAVDLQIPAGSTVALLGANGSGKSTALGIVAGLLRPDAGRVELAGRVLTDTGRGLFVPPHRRGVTLLAQEPLLFPHLSVAANVEFGPRSGGMSRAAARAAAAAWLAEVDSADLAERSPRQLSGGQAQRVALARALAAGPELLLLDEPMAALDVTAVPQLRELLRRVLAGRTAIIVTHELLDALTLADEVVVLDGGHIAERGPTSEVLSRPRSPFAARISGVNLIAGVAGSPGELVGPAGVRIHGLGACRSGEAAVAVFHPRAVTVHSGSPTGSARNVLAVKVASLEPHGDTVRVRAADFPEGAAGPAADITAIAASELGLVPGMTVRFAIKAQEVAIYSVPADF